MCPTLDLNRTEEKSKGARCSFFQHRVVREEHGDLIAIGGGGGGAGETLANKTDCLHMQTGLHTGHSHPVSLSWHRAG